MDDRIRICLWMIGVGAFGAILGGIFGGLGAMLFARTGHAAGTGLARRIADAFARASEQEPSSLERAIVVGATDGFFFLGILGLISGSLMGLSGRSVKELLVPIVVGSVLLAGGAIALGSVAYVLRYRAAEFLYGMAGGFLGTVLASYLFGSPYGPAGLVPGMFVARVLCRAVRRYAPKFHSPHIDPSTPTLRSRTNTNITGMPHSPPDVDDFYKKDSVEE